MVLKSNCPSKWSKLCLLPEVWVIFGSENYGEHEKNLVESVCKRFGFFISNHGNQGSGPWIHSLSIYKDEDSTSTFTTPDNYNQGPEVMCSGRQTHSLHTISSN